MRKALAEVLQRLPHQMPSLNHSLLSGLASVGVELVGENVGPSNPMSWAAAGDDATQASNATPTPHPATRTRARKRPESFMTPSSCWATLDGLPGCFPPESDRSAHSLEYATLVLGVETPASDGFVDRCGELEGGPRSAESGLSRGRK